MDLFFSHLSIGNVTFSYEHDTDKLMQLLKFTDEKGNPIGMANWFPVHLVSMNNSNKLISSDNKGYAAIKFEQDFNGYSNIGMVCLALHFLKKNLKIFSFFTFIGTLCKYFWPVK